jgi:pimeloyl-ACP methyl ester carboxylesterase
MEQVMWTRSGVRLRLRESRAGDLNWLFLPGGPGIGSESLQELIDATDVPGHTWLVDLPGDGNNINAPGAPPDPYRLWPQVLLEAAQAVANPVYVGHSTGGQYLLSTPALAGHLAGLALISSAPDASWMPVFEEMVANHPLPGVERAPEMARETACKKACETAFEIAFEIVRARYESEPTAENLRALSVESAPWNFVGDAVATGAELLARMPYNQDAVQFSAQNFDRDYELAWWPTTLPTLIVSGSKDRIVTQSLWRAKRFQTENVSWHVIPEAGHFPWIEQPVAVRDAFAELARRVLQSRNSW